MSKYESIAEETPGFQVVDLLVSRTDDRGVIIAANPAFVRISGHDWEGLNNAPHKLIRHPDMPKGVFWLFWDKLKSKEIFAAFVKNKSKNGMYYWVFALVAPTADGYQSFRMKPTGEAVDEVSQLYRQLLWREAQDGLTPDQGAGHLLEGIKTLGFRSYEHFAAHSAAQQFSARSKELGRSIPPVLRRLIEVQEDWNSINAACESLKDANHRIANTPTNLRVQAAHLNTRGIPLGVIASNFTVLAGEIQSIMAQFLNQAELTDTQLQSCVFNTCAGSLMGEVAGELKRETTELDGVDWNIESALMTQQEAQTSEKAQNALVVALQEIRRFLSLLDETSRVLSGLSVAKVMCEIENAYVGGEATSGVKDIISELDLFQTRTRDGLFSIRKTLVHTEQKILDIQAAAAPDAKRKVA